MKERDKMDKAVDILWMVFCIVMLIVSLNTKDILCTGLWLFWCIFNYYIEQSYDN